MPIVPEYTILARDRHPRERRYRASVESIASVASIASIASSRLFGSVASMASVRSVWFGQQLWGNEARAGRYGVDLITTSEVKNPIIEKSPHEDEGAGDHEVGNKLSKSLSYHLL